MERTQEIMRQARAAALAFRTFDQEATDRIVRAVYLAALDARLQLARMAHEETGIGVVEHKVLKNVIAAQLVYEDIKAQRTVGVIAEEERSGIVEVAQSRGPILCFIPVTNPTATMIFKALICLKTRNPIIVSPQQGARRSIAAAAELCYRAARAAGAPEHCIQWLTRPNPALVDELLQHPALALIIATGTDSLVRKAATSGCPTLGVGPGNVPVYIGSTADIPFAVRSILMSKTFDNGTVCASEQAVVVKEMDVGRIVPEFERQGAYFLTPEESDAVGRVAWDPLRRTMMATVVGQPVARIAATAGISVPSGTSVLMARLEGVGREFPLSAEILAPILAFYVEDDFDGAIRRCSEITHFGGVGHSAVIYSNRDERIEYFSRTIDAGRILVNMPSTHGAIGGMYNTLSPSFTLSCGSGGNNLTTDNITTHHLLNIHRITRRRPNSRWFDLPQERYLDDSVSASTLEAEYNRNF